MSTDCQTIREERSGFHGAVLATVNEYDSYGRLARIAADYEPAVEYLYDATGARVATVQSADGQWRKTETASSFVLVSGDVWRAETNAVSCSVSAIAPLVTSSAAQLTGLTAANPARVRTTDIRGDITENVLGVSGSVSTAMKAVPHATNKPLSLSRYDVSVMEVSVSAVTNSFAYDGLNRPVAAHDALGNMRGTGYDLLDRPVSTTDPRGKIRTTAYDVLGRQIASTRPSGATERFGYDGLGNLVTITNAEGRCVRTRCLY